MPRRTQLLTILLCCLGMHISFAQQKKVLVFSKTAGFRHASIKEGKEFFQAFGPKEGFAVTLTENSDDFTEENLKNFHAVVFLSTTGDVLNPRQQADFERFIQAGGGYVGIHAASDTEYNWPWYNHLMGGYFASHPGGSVSNVQKGTMYVLDPTHPSTRHLPATFEREDEFYDFKDLKKDILKFLIRVDEKSYQQGKMGDFHPLAWFHEFDGGKSFYTNYGHTPETFTDPAMQKHILEGLKWAMATKLDYTKAKTVRAPEENRFIKTTLVKNLDEPTELVVMPNGKVLFTERKGNVKVWNPVSGKTKIVAQLDVYKKFEYGVMGAGIDPQFNQNNWVYLFYTPNTEAHNDQFLSRFVYDQQKDTLLLDTEKIVLRFPVKRVECCHTGGSIDWDKEGNLYLSTGDDTNPFASDGYAPIDFREGRQGWDALHTAGNTNDLRGKILRIKPTQEGGYTIPDGNLFPVGTPKTRPEIFVMGTRNAYRISVDPKTSYLYWGDIGPDAGKANPDRGPEGQVELNQAKKAGFFGWPLFVGKDAYRAYNFETKESGPAFDKKQPKNNSPHNTGLTDLPPTQEPLIWYGYGPTERFPLLGKGGANPMSGPLFYRDQVKVGPGTFPEYFHGKWFIYEWMRDWIHVVQLDENGNYAGMEPFMPSTKFYHPMDMTFDQNGVMYLLEYGMNWFSQNEEAMLSKIEFNAGNRKPIAKMQANKTVGSAPLTVQFSSKGSLDYDQDPISFQWTFGPKSKPSLVPNPIYTFTQPGEYTVKLTVKDTKGNSQQESMVIKVGNAQPEIAIQLEGNQSFYFDQQPIPYKVHVKDKEDGVLAKGVAPEDVVVNINYMEGFDKTVLEQGHKANVGFVVGKRLIDLSDCKACHAQDKKSIGPAYLDIAKKYPRTNQNVNYLAEKIIQGGGGVWGEQAMSAHPQLTKNEARDMVEYILSLNDKKKASEPVAGTYIPKSHLDKKPGTYLIQATYTDKGGKVIGPLTSTQTVALRSAKMPATSYDTQKDAAKFTVPNVGEVVVANHGGFIAWEKVDLTGIRSIEVNALAQAGQTAGGKIKIRVGSEQGKLIGEGTIPTNFASTLSIPVATQDLGSNQTLYLTFDNTVSQGKPLFGLSQIEFKK